MKSDPLYCGCASKGIKPTFTLSLLKSLIENRVHVDPAFRGIALSSPGDAFRQLMGLTLPSGFTLEVTGEQIDISIPDGAYAPVAEGVAVVSTNEWRMVVSATDESTDGERLCSG
jgi:hypothetical protein